jgi:hypothetical protein
LCGSTAHGGSPPDCLVKAGGTTAGRNSQDGCVPFFKRLLGRNGHYYSPKGKTFRRVLASVDPVVFQCILCQWQGRALDKAQHEADIPVTIDGMAQCASTPDVTAKQNAQLVTAWPASLSTPKENDPCKNPPPHGRMRA